MKILLVHNFYGSSAPSGEDEVFRNEVELLRKKGHQVIVYVRHNDDLLKRSKLSSFFNTIWSREVYKDLKNLIKINQPDIAHFHNIWYLISPSAYYACKDSNIPVIQTLHNFRTFCVNGLLLRKGEVCERCIGKKPWRGVLYGCYRGSILYSLSVALTEGVHTLKGTWKDMINSYVALTEFGRMKCTEAGLPEEKMAVKPNFLLDPPKPSFRNDNSIIFLGRLSPEKGLTLLLDAFKILGGISSPKISLKIIGDGPLLKEVKEKIEVEKIGGIDLIGRKNHHESMELIKKAKFMVMPTLCYEMFPLTTIEAFACGKPVVASRLGAITEIVKDGETGMLFEPSDPQDLALKMRWLIENENACAEMGKKARSEFERKYTAEVNYQKLIDIYEKTINRRQEVKRIRGLEISLL